MTNTANTTIDKCALSALQAKLDAYSKELRLFNDLTLDALIDAHRNLRSQAMLDNQERLAQLTAAREAAAKLAREEVLTREFISVARLRTMTLAEIAAFIDG